MNVRTFFQTIQWGPTFQVGVLRAAIAALMWTVIIVAAGSTQNATFLAQLAAAFFGLLVALAIAIPAIGLARANIPLVGLLALPAWLIVIADPLVKIIHSVKPNLVPVEEFKLVNPPVLAVFDSPGGL